MTRYLVDTQSIYAYHMRETTRRDLSSMHDHPFSQISHISQVEARDRDTEMVIQRLQQSIISLFIKIF